MKTFILAACCLISPLSHASRCFVVNSCLKSVSTCNLDKRTSYNSHSGIVDRSATLKYEWKQNIECLHFNGKKTQITKSGAEAISNSASVKVEELRIPATLQEVPAFYVMRASEEALDLCEESKESLMNSSQSCL